MGVRTTITNKGLQLLASSSQATGQYYWLGYYALAYVPDFWKTTEENIDFPDPSCFKVNTGDTIDETSTEPVTSSMQRLTTNGDMIWNVWQGDLTGTGFIEGSDGTPGGDLFGLTMYAENIKKHYRYVLDENGNNVLVTWINDPASTTGDMKYASTYIGTDGFVASEMPIPAPLYYLGDVTGMLAAEDFFPDFADSDENGSSIYPFIEVEVPGSDSILVPKVSVDFRGYLDTLGNGDGTSYAPSISGPLFYPAVVGGDNDIPYTADPQFEVTSWYAADSTYLIPEDVKAFTSPPDITNQSAMNNDPAKFATEFWKMYTSSNYNRWHAPVNNIGFLLGSDLANRNMAKTTKFFPISNYKTINTESGFTSNGEAVEVATAIQLTIDLDISPSTTTDGTDVGAITSFDKYEEANDGNPSPSPIDQYGNSVFESTHSSIKFNRVGIYAVALRKHPCVQDQGFGGVPTSSGACAAGGNATELQFQIDPDEEPVLFAVLDWDNTVTLDDTGNGLSSFHAEVNVNLESPDGVEDTSLIRDCTIFYNLYEDDALKWYQNQLIANAQTQNAITELGLEVGSMLGKGGDDCCPSPDLSDLYAARNHTHSGLGLRNLKDARIMANNGLRGIATLAETSDLDGTPYELGVQAVALGFETAAAAANSTVAGGETNIIFFDAHNSFIGSGAGNEIRGDSSYSVITGGNDNVIDSSQYAHILGGVSHVITNSNRASVAGTDHAITDSDASSIFGGSSHVVESSNAASILGGASSNIINSQYSTIIGGPSNVISCTTAGSNIANNIIGSAGATIDGESTRAGVYSSSSTTISNSSNSAIIGSSDTTSIGDANHAVIIGSQLTTITSNSVRSAIMASNNSDILDSTSSTIIASNGIALYGGKSNIAVIARTVALPGTVLDATLYTDNFNFVGNMTANNTTGSDGDILTKVAGVPKWTPNGAVSFNWVDWPQPVQPVIFNSIGTIYEWDVQYAIVSGLVFLRGEFVADFPPRPTAQSGSAGLVGWWTHIADTMPNAMTPSATRHISLLDVCTSTGNTAYITAGADFALGGLKLLTSTGSSESSGSINIEYRSELTQVDYGPRTISLNGAAYPL